MPLPNIAGAALGPTNYQDATVRERRTDGFDMKFNFQLSPKDQVSVRYSFQRPTVFEPGNYAGGVFGGPYQGGFVGTGINKTQSAAGNWTRTLTNTLVMDARFGVSTYHNQAVSAGSGLTTATDVGIPGANLDEFTSGMTAINLQGYSNPLVGFSASLPWNRGETTYTARRSLTKLKGNHTIKFGGDYRHNADYLLQTQDQGGSRGFFTFNGGADRRRRAIAASQNNVANSLAAFLLDRPSHGRPRPRGHPEAGHASTRRSSPSSTTSGRCRRR